MEKYSLVSVTRNSEKIFNLISEVLSLEPNEWLKEFIIVDNHSDEEFIEELDKFAKAFNKIKIIKLDKNWLYSYATNNGILRSSHESKYVIIINPDISMDIKKNNLNIFIEEMIKNNIKIAGAKLLFPNGRVEHAGCVDNRHLEYGEIDKPDNDFIRIVEWATGAFLAIEKQILETIGFLDEKTFPHWVSDQEFCRRAKHFGIDTYFIPIKFEHAQGSSTKNPSHVECDLDLPKGIIPNKIPVTLEFIKEKALDNYKLIKTIW